MMRLLLVLVLLMGLAVGCETTGTRDRAFTDDWAIYNRKNPQPDRRAPVEKKEKVEERIGPATITHDEQGRPKLNVGGNTGLGADVGYRGGPSGRVRYKHEWDFVKPQRGRE